MLHLRVSLQTMRLLTLLLIFFLSGFAYSQSYFLNGNASAQGNGCYTITPEIGWQNGTVWYSDQLNLNENFTLEFLMNFGTTDGEGADGMVFVLQTVGTSAIGINGAGMGFQGFNPSFGIEFDTFSNSESGDMVADHVAFLRDGVVNHNATQNLAGPVQANSSNINIEDGNDHIVRISWNATTNVMELYVDCALRLSLQNNIVASVFGNNSNVYWGFTGATGFYYNLQTVCLQQFFYHNVEDQAICSGGFLQLAASGNPLGNFEWQPTTGLDDPNSQTPLASPEVTTTYCCTYTDLCNQTSETCIEVIVENEPLVYAGNDSIICEGDVIDLYALCDLPGVSYSWSTSLGNIISGENSSTPTIDATGDYVVTTTTPFADCSSSDEVHILVWELPEIVLENPYSICPNGELLLHADFDDGWVMWFDGSLDSTLLVNEPGTFGIDVFNEYCSNHFDFEVLEVVMPILELGADVLACENDVVVLNSGVSVDWNTGENATQIQVQIAGEYSATLTIDECAISDSVQVDFTELPTLSLGSDLLLCEGELDTIQINQVGIWSDGSVDDHYVIGSESGLFWVTINNGPCEISDSIQVNITPIPQFDLGPDVVYCIGETYSLTVPMGEIGDVNWSDGSTESELNIRESGDYWLSISNWCGGDVDSIFIQFEECDFLIYAPNAFTPDDDGINDFFNVYTMNLLHTELSIYDRFGAQIFHDVDGKLLWDGSVNGGDYYAMNGIYNWQIKYTTDKLDAGERRGFVVLIR